jgi:hypothetical protein
MIFWNQKKSGLFVDPPSSLNWQNTNAASPNAYIMLLAAVFFGFFSRPRMSAKEILLDDLRILLVGTKPS